MAKQLLTILAVILCTAVFGQTGITFKESNFKFGKIKQNKPVTHEFTFTNTGTKPVVIEFANAECGCTTPEYPKNAILKGQSAKIKVTYDAATPGVFKKNVNIKFAHEQLPTVLTIEGEVTTGQKG